MSQNLQPRESETNQAESACSQRKAHEGLGCHCSAIDSVERDGEIGAPILSLVGPTSHTILGACTSRGQCSELMDNVNMSFLSKEGLSMRAIDE